MGAGRNLSGVLRILKAYLRILRGSWVGPEVGIFEKDLIAGVIKQVL